MMRWIAGMREALRGVFFRRREDAETEEELRFHVEMEADHLARKAGLDPREARRRAMAAFGGVPRYKEEVRDARGLAWVPGLSLDLKLGLRNLVRYPGLAIVGGLGMAVAIAIGAGAHAVIHSYFYPAIPLDEGERIVRILKVDRGRPDEQLLHDLLVWRRELRSVVDVGAFRTVARNLINESGEGEPISLAEMTASGFTLARISPIRGRALLESDEHPSAPPVIVIGYEAWQTRFGGDPQVVGRTMRFGNDVHTIVGVMPEGFAFPVNHKYWVPLRTPPDGQVLPGSGPSIDVFGRLAGGETPATAETELAAIVERQRQTASAGDLEGTRFRYKPLVAPYSDVFTNARAENEAPVYRMLQFVLSLLMVVVCLNVAVLVYARTVARTTEVAVRTALGATRRRIVGQLFAEAFVLSGLSALVGLGLVAVGLRFLDQSVGGYGGGPFWIDGGLSAGTVVYALALGILGAVIVGVFPALRATGKQLRMAMGPARGSAGAQLGGTWTFLIVAQVAVAVAVLPVAMLQGSEMFRHASQSLGFPAEEFLSANFSLDASALDGAGGATPDSARRDALRSIIPALAARLESHPAVAGVSVGLAIPGDGGTDDAELEAGVAPITVRSTSVDERFFDVFGAKLVAGRNFSTTDAAMNAGRPVIVNRSFVNEALGGGDALGRRIRYPSESNPNPPWHDIVGVIEDFPPGYRDPTQTGVHVYHLTRASERLNGRLFVRLRGMTPDAFVPTLRRIAPTVDATLQLSSGQALSAIYAEERKTSGLLALAIAIITGSVLLLSAAGIHALMTFTVNQRRREIGVRAALGADARHILTSILSRATWQLALGLAVGLVLAFTLDFVAEGAMLGGKGAMIVPVVAVVMMVVGLLAAAGPARRGLRTQPTEALRAEV